VFGLGAGESFNLLEIYWERVYERLQDSLKAHGFVCLSI
jgi:hypothetical protein